MHEAAIVLLVAAGGILLIMRHEGGEESSVPLVVKSVVQEKQEVAEPPSMEVDAPPETRDALLSKDEEFLAKIVAAYGMPEDGMAGLSPRGMGRVIAGRNMKPLYSTRLEAITDRLSAQQAARFLECVSADIAAGRLPSNYMTEPLRDVAVIWDPVGREFAERAVLNGGAGSLVEGKIRMRDRLYMMLRVSPQERSIIDYGAISTLNPEGKMISKVAKSDLAEIELRYARRIVSFIRGGGVVDAYFDARAVKWVSGDYIALPFDAQSTLNRCTSQGVRKSLNGVAMSEGWVVSAEVRPGDSLRYDQEKEHVLSLAHQRDAELKDYISAIP